VASCSQVNSLFQAYIDGELGHAEKSILEEHLHSCVACQKELAAQRAFGVKVVEALSDQRLIWGLRSRVLAHLPEMDAAPKYASHPTDPCLSSRKERSQLPWLLAGAAAVLVILSLGLVQTQTPRLYEDSIAQEREASNVVGMVTFNDGSGVVCQSQGESSPSLAALKSFVREDDRYETSSEGRLAIALVGNSLVKANYDTVLNVVDNRRIHVESGLTYFDVGRQKRHFYVDTPAGEIQVYGTAFVVDTARDSTTVTVAEGDILVRNGVGIAAVSIGNQLTFTRNEPMPMPHAVDVDRLVAWANAIVPDAGAMELFRQTLGLRGTENLSIPAEPVYALGNLAGRVVESIVVKWRPDGQTGGHCSYAIHVSDGQGHLRMLSTIDDSVFDVPGVETVEISVPDKPITGVNVLHIKLIPDHTDGDREADILEVSAVATWQ